VKISLGAVDALNLQRCLLIVTNLACVLNILTHSGNPPLHEKNINLDFQFYLPRLIFNLSECVLHCVIISRRSYDTIY